ncbi:MAG: carboxy-S-adenosyl-L-methionine synthase CmoA [Pseudobacteriovorax sp.]|nr:carboxy-S-adenosyl-L-methionine synthase CmoA [Pseudobacteriovorax sp.]
MEHSPDLILNSARDELFAQSNYPKPFAFNKEVAEVFDNMVERSIPLYEDVTKYVARWIHDFAADGGKIYDIGCSTGTTLLHIAQTLKEPTTLVGIDNAQAMIEKAREKTMRINSQHMIHFICDDVMNIDIKDASAVVVNYTLQFLPIVNRQKLLNGIYEGLRPGGILFMSEKVRASCPEFQETTTRIYENFKETQGYSRTEIEQKKEALDNVLVPLTEKEHHRCLEKAGFDSYESVMRWNTFLSIVAMKG